ncbi:hypothetical protein [Hydromonas duriensis]|uniref:Uncharacterized protein n=1 Tax=Hydromonas duriensis TaxID=1527608 RepID=A0A4R6Y1K0_9BURK|nr:hypothetical protein [Hydromonas duriensis]TDR30302.1 hypothetical protein DFR44_12326 [Hydromonas duriensis]
MIKLILECVILSSPLWLFLGFKFGYLAVPEGVLSANSVEDDDVHKSLFTDDDNPAHSYSCTNKYYGTLDSDD